MPQSRAFSLLELLVVVALLAVIIALAAPAFRVAQRSAHATQSLAVLRQLGAAVSAYTFDNRMALPYFAEPGNPDSPTSINGIDISGAQGGYFQRQSTYWATLTRPYFDGNPKLSPTPCFRGWGGTGTSSEPATFDPSSESIVLWSRYWMTCTAFATPEFWVGSALPAGHRHMLRGTRTSQIRYPARKGLLLDTAGGYFLDMAQGRNGNDAWIAFADGSVRIESALPVPSSVSRPFSAISIYPIMSTEGGLGGIDY